MSKRLDSLIAKLATKNVKPMKVDKATKLMDPVIWITESIYIQVGKDYAVVFNSKMNSFAMYTTDNSFKDIYEKLEQAIKG